MGPKLKTKPPFPTFKAKLRMPKAGIKKPKIHSGMHLAKGMFKGIKRKSMSPKMKIKF